jgi:hypothetical protein
VHCITLRSGGRAICVLADRLPQRGVVDWLEICVEGLSFTAKESLMQMLYNSDSFAVVMFDVSDETAGASPGGPIRGGYEIVDKFARKEIFIEGALAQSFKEGVEALIESAPSEEEIDEYLGRFSSLMQHPVILH